MPDGSARTATWTPAGSLQKLNTLSETKLAHFCTKSVQGQLGACKEVLSSLAQGRAPNFEKALQSGGYLKTFIGLAGLFCRHTIMNPKAPTLELCGKDVVLAKFEEAKKATAANAKGITLPELEPLHMYSWLLTKAQIHEVEQMTSSIVGACVSSGTRLKTKTSPASLESTAEARAKKAKKAAADADVDSLFS